MDVSQAILERRSIRRYKDEPLADELLEQILTAATYAPSATNLQPWYFVVLKSEVSRSRIKKLMAAVADRTVPELEARFGSHPQVIAETTAFINTLGNAPVCILAFQNEPQYKTAETTIIQSVAAAIENMLLSAWNMGIGSCWITAPIVAEMSDVFQKEFARDHGSLVALITMGYPEVIPKAPRRKDARYIIV